MKADVEKEGNSDINGRKGGRDGKQHAGTMRLKSLARSPTFL